MPAMQKRMIDAMKTIPGVTFVGLIDLPPSAAAGDTNESPVFTDEGGSEAIECRACIRNVQISPHASARRAQPLLLGRALTWHDDKNAPPGPAGRSSRSAPFARGRTFADQFCPASVSFFTFFSSFSQLSTPTPL
jgi:hypothetical protein